MRQLGWQVDVTDLSMKNYDQDELFMEQMDRLLKKKYDCIFSFDFYPILSRIAMQHDIRYISWVFDSPHLTLESVALENPCNVVFLFDHNLLAKYRRQGIRTVYYMPLAYNHRRLQRLLGGRMPSYRADVTFLGTLYNDKNNFFDQIQYLPEELKGYIDGMIESQLLVYGYDFCDHIFDDAKCREMGRYAQIDMGSLYRDCKNDILRDMIRKKMTVIERRRLLELIAAKYEVTLYAPEKPADIKLRYKGYAEYHTQMPQIFYNSRINLNITLRSIQSGIPLRVIDILGAGGFLLTNYQSELADYFSYGETIMWYESPEDMMMKIDYYLKHDTEREQLALKGHERAEQIFTYERLLPEIFQIAMGRSE
ncbi:MAG: glycosyltransferase [Lachnospiraceae bacterium]|nr:glycosyltransferase [Lachnospiraceae bacterium]